MKLVLAALSLLLFLCCNDERKNPECGETRKAAQAAALGDELDKAEQLLEEAKRVCGDASQYEIERVERLISRARRRATLAAQHSGSSSPLAEFVSWVSSLREAGDKALPDHSCAERTSDRFGLCSSRKQSSSGVAYVVDYFRDDPSVFRFHVTLDQQVGCLDLGVHRDLSGWRVGNAELERCDLTGSGLMGLRGLIERANGSSTVSLFSADYPKVDKAFAQKLER